MHDLRLVFDLDDTLYPERAYAIGGFRAAGAWAKSELGVDGVADRLLQLLDAGHLGQSFHIALTELAPNHTDGHAKALLKAYGEHTPDLTVFDDASAALEAFSGTTLGLITDGHAKTQARKVTALGLAPRFAEIIYTGALGPDRAFHKPHPRAFEKMEQALRRAPSDRFVYVGDNPLKDFVAPNAMGWRTVLVDRPAHRLTRIHPLQAPPPGGAPHITLASLVDLFPVLNTTMGGAPPHRAVP
jgi:putative hydrolase of the HAD superfamily